MHQHNKELNITCEDIKNGSFGNRLKCINNEVYIKRAYWIGHYYRDHHHHDFNTTEYIVGICKFCQSFYYSKPGRYIPLNQSNQCLHGRTDQLCSCCLNSSSPAVNSRHFECLECNKKTVAEFFLMNVFGLFFLCIFIFLFDFFPASGALNALIFFGQMITTAVRIDCMGDIPMKPVFKFDDQLNYIIEFIYGIWNLDFTYETKQFCFAQNFHTIHVLAITYAIALMPLVPVAILFLLVKYLGKIYNMVGRTCNRIVGEGCMYWMCCGCIQSFPCCEKVFRFDKWKSIKTLVASCLLLAYTKFAMTTFYLLAPMKLYDSQNNVIESVLYYQGNLKYMGSAHTPYGLLAIFFLITYVIGFPLALLLLRYKPFLPQRTTVHDLNQQSSSAHSNTFSTKALKHFNDFLDHFILKPFQKDLKWGKDPSGRPCVALKWWRFSFGIHDYRWYAGWYFLLRFSLFAANLFAMDFVVQLLLNELLCTIALTISLVAQPYRRKAHNRIDGIILVLMTFLNTLVFFQYYLTYTNQPLDKGTYIVQCAIMFFPAICLVLYFIAKLVRNYKRPSSTDNDTNVISELITAPNTPLLTNHHSLSSAEVNENFVQKFINQYLCGCNKVSLAVPSFSNSKVATGTIEDNSHVPLLASGTVNYADLSTSSSEDA